VTLISLLFARLTLNNWRAKLISLILATTLWYLIKKNLETTPSPIRVPARNMSTGKASMTLPTRQRIIQTGEASLKVMRCGKFIQ
jgi:hypothetical protein